ncbi:unnamed protein product [Rhizoctonia solani]|uniref:Uncharacterized protein n=1 Tax=Rhizoctonia solani TaxID=456999 RepID=A0A8H2X5I5_9AGAM|nr:unnamed protein product [Rhizoctonia solani]
MSNPQHMHSVSEGGKPRHDTGSTDAGSDSDTITVKEIHPSGLNRNVAANSNQPNRPNSHIRSHRGVDSASQRKLEVRGATNVHLVHVGRNIEREREREGVKAFEDFDREADDMDAALRLLGSTIQLFGSIVGVFHAIYQLRKSLLRLKFRFRENAVYLYEDYVEPNEKRHVRQ